MEIKKKLVETKEKAKKFVTENFDKIVVYGGVIVTGVVAGMVGYGCGHCQGFDDGFDAGFDHSEDKLINSFDAPNGDLFDIMDHDDMHRAAIVKRSFLEELTSEVGAELLIDDKKITVKKVD